MSNRLYVGYKSAGKGETFWSATKPTHSSHGKTYLYVVGPFVTKAGAEFMRMFGHNNPHCQTVRQAERLARWYAEKQSRLAGELLEPWSAWAQRQGEREAKKPCPVCLDSACQTKSLACGN